MTDDNFNLSLVAESKNAVKYLLEMIETTFPKHYEVLKNAVSCPPSALSPPS